MKDHYQALELGPQASTEEIKKSFRKLAHEFHPDKNPDNVFAETHFREIQQAYHILSHPAKRKLYDHERWLSGKFKHNATAITPAYLLREIELLNAHIAVLDVHRMNKELLHRYLLFLMNDEKIAIIAKRADNYFFEAFTQEILQSAQKLPFYFSLEVVNRLLVLVPEQYGSLIAKVTRQQEVITRAALWQKLAPWLIVLITLCICGGMYWFSRQ